MDIEDTTSENVILDNQVPRCFKHGNEASASIKRKVSLDQLNDYQRPYYDK
jgi:hypothetical protein